MLSAKQAKIKHFSVQVWVVEESTEQRIDCKFVDMSFVLLNFKVSGKSYHEKVAVKKYTFTKYTTKK